MRDLRWWLFPAWLAAFYACWLALLIFGGYFDLMSQHGAIAVAMAIGSYVAGSTPMGGGTIGFPVLVLIFDQPADIGRQFSFAVQSIGMVSAAIFIFATRRPVAWRLLGWACAGASIGTPLGVVLLTPVVNDLVVKLTFAVLWASFGLMHFAKVREFVQLKGIGGASQRFVRTTGLLVGVLGGGTLAALTGVGVDMLVYVVLVLLLRCDLRMAIPTSVILMAFTSLVGVMTMVTLGQLSPDVYPIKPGVFGNWIAAAPVVALGAPFGALMVHLIPRTWTLLIVSALCIVQFVWTGVHEQLGFVGWSIAIIAVFGCNVVFIALHRWGVRRERATRAA